jgi:sterol desaturase/sphingolipid hydroxylase (fatty acid hydroxylase superfamily)
MHDPIALAVPFFFLLIGVELVWAKARGRKIYRFADAITDLSCGISSQVVLLAWAATQLAIYAWVYDHRLLSIDRPAVAWVVAMIGVDFFYYWWHRMSHEVNFLWAAHVVHHQSEDYNLAVALRQSIITSWTSLPFYLPLAIFGVPPIVFATAHAINTLYQFWIHTELVGKIRGPLDWILNLPSHHRVHHAINPRYLDKNYGGILIVWDRLFGTYVEETEPCVYGITKPLGSFDPAWAQVHYWFEMASMARHARRAGDKLKVWLASPAWKPEGVEAPPPKEITREAWKKYDPRPSRGTKVYVGLHFALVVLATFVFMTFHRSLPPLTLWVGGAAILLSLSAFSALLEQKRWATTFEIVRLAASGGAVVSWVLGK